MTYTHQQLSKAQKEILEAWEWYENKQLGLGDSFKQAIKNKINSIIADPFKFPLKGKFHEALADDFPFLIIYSINAKENKVFIVSVFHTSRHPKKKA